MNEMMLRFDNLMRNFFVHSPFKAKIMLDVIVGSNRRNVPGRTGKVQCQRI